MRLTLRTLLAYMDDILDPADQEELGRKIESSDFATELIHRSRDTVRRLRLGAPDVFSGESDDVLGDDGRSDANTVAEYLDNTLSPEQVAEFEQHCLGQGGEADMILAETSSCHHVLTMVLGEPAEVDDQLRRRLYAIGATAATVPSGGDALRVEPAHLLPTSPPVEPAAQPAAEPEPSEDHVPDYLRAAAAAERRAHRMLAAAAVAALICGGLAFAFWPAGDSVDVSQGADQGFGSTDDLEGEESAPIANIDVLADPEEEDGDAANSSSDETSSDDPTDSSPPAGGPVDSDAAAGIEPSELSVEEGDLATVVANDETLMQDSEPPQAETLLDDDGQTSQVDSEIADSIEPEIAIAPNEVADAQDGSAAESGELTANVEPQLNADASASEDMIPHEMELSAAASTPGDLTVPAVPDPVPGDLGAPGADRLLDAAESIPGDTTPMDDATVGAGPGDVATEPGFEAEATGPMIVGAYLGNDDVLMIFDRDTGSWIRLSPGGQLYEGDQILTLPTFRAHVVLSDMNAFLSGGTQLVLGHPDADADVGADSIAIQLRRGRVVLNAGLNGNRVDVHLGAHVHSVDLEKSSTLAIETHLGYVLGGDMQGEPADLTADWILTSGSARILETGGEKNVDGPSKWATSAGSTSAVEVVETLPEWIAAEPVTDLERRARDQIADSFGPGQPIAITLLEFADKSSRGRRRENRTLATECGMYVGQFEPFVRALNDVDLRAYWGELISTVRQSIAANPASVQSLQQAIESLRGEAAAADLLAMTLGFDLGALGQEPDESQEAVLRQLVRWMDSDQLDYRVLAFHSLSELTGTDGLGGYRPWHLAGQRARSLRHYSDLEQLWERVQANAQSLRE